MICGQQDREQVKTVHLLSEDLAKVGYGRILIARLSQLWSDASIFGARPSAKGLLLCAISGRVEV
jgi:hypothetical protein